MKERIDEMREWAAHRARRASLTEDQKDEEPLERIEIV